MRTYPTPDPENVGSVPRSLPPELLKPTYQNRLRTIGREIDRRNCRSVFVLEVDGGFVVRAVQRSERDIDLLQFPDDEFPERMILATEDRGLGERSGSPSAIGPTGYEDLFRAIGRWFDDNHVRHVAIAETMEHIVLTGDLWSGDTRVKPFEARMDETMITQLLDDSFGLRVREGDL
jgi:hypothetical protein